MNLAFNRQQRWRAKNHFNELISKYSDSETHFLTGNLIAEKWQFETQPAAKKCRRFNHDLSCNYKNENVDVLTVRIHGKKVYKPNLKKEKEKKAENFAKPTTKCKVCNKRTFLSRKNKKYCSKTCNNVANGKKRRQREKAQRHREQTQLNKILTKIGKEKSRFWLLATYSDGGIVESVQLQPNEINPPKEFIKNISAVSVLYDDKRRNAVHLTAGRARNLIRQIIKINNNENKKLRKN